MKKNKPKLADVISAFPARFVNADEVPFGDTSLLRRLILNTDFPIPRQRTGSQPSASVAGNLFTLFDGRRRNAAGTLLSVREKGGLAVVALDPQEWAAVGWCFTFRLQRTALKERYRREGWSYRFYWDLRRLVPDHPVPYSLARNIMKRIDERRIVGWIPLRPRIRIGGV